MSDKKRMTSILRNEMGFQMRYIERAFTVYEDNYGNDYNIEIIAELIYRLKCKDNGKNINFSETDSSNTNESDYDDSKSDIKEDNYVMEFIPHMSINEAHSLRINDKIDHRDNSGRFSLGIIIDKKGHNLKIHYEGWSWKWDIWSDFTKEIHRFAHPNSISKRESHRFNDLKKGDYVDINPMYKHPGWKIGEIKGFYGTSGQVQIAYEYNGKYQLYWAHLDNENEIQEFNSKISVKKLFRSKSDNINVRRKQISLKAGNHTHSVIISLKKELQYKDEMIQKWKNEYCKIKRELDALKLKHQNDVLKCQSKSLNNDPIMEGVPYTFN
mmetsp:Transcript_108639/g.132588  ORF Transcript_108639/g.132588 Transcript_108639/m.132588 type:complete len:326 (+) Transcript_108639:88-1065(+)